MKPLHGFLIVGIMVFWGFNLVVAKVGMETLPPIFMIALRFALVALILVPFVRIPRAQLKPIAVLSVTLGCAHFSLMFTGLHQVDAAVAAIVIQAQVPLAALLAAVVFRERLGWRRAAGMVVALVGVAIIAGAPETRSNILAVLMILAAALTWAVANIQMKDLARVNGFALNAWLSVFATPQLLIASFALESGQWEALIGMDWLTVGTILYQSILVVIICYSLWYWMLRQYDVNQTMPFTLLVPVFGVFSGVIFLDEPLTWSLVAGGAATIVGVGVIISARRQAEGQPRHGPASSVAPAIPERGDHGPGR